MMDTLTWVLHLNFYAALALQVYCSINWTYFDFWEFPLFTSDMLLISILFQGYWRDGVLIWHNIRCFIYNFTLRYTLRVMGYWWEVFVFVGLWDVIGDLGRDLILDWNNFRLCCYRRVQKGFLTLWTLICWFLFFGSLECFGGLWTYFHN